MERGLVSVIITCYNYGHFLEEAVGSVVAQSYRQLEVVIIDDGSTDKTSDVGNRLADELGVVRFVRTENRGVSAARNYGISISRGEFILALDADDVLYPWALEVLTARMAEDQKFGFVYGGLDVIGGLPGEPTSWIPGPFSTKLLTVENLSSVTALWRRSLFDDGVQFRQGFFYEDWDLWLQIAARGYFGGYVTKPIFKCRVHQDGRTSTAKYCKMFGLAQQARANPDLFSDPAFGRFSKKLLSNEKTCFSRATAIFLLPKETSNSRALEQLLPLINAFDSAGHCVVLIGTLPPEAQSLGVHTIDLAGYFSFDVISKLLESFGHSVAVFAHSWEERFLRYVKASIPLGLMVTVERDMFGISDFSLSSNIEGYSLSVSLCEAGRHTSVSGSSEEIVEVVNELALVGAKRNREAQRTERKTLLKLSNDSLSNRQTHTSASDIATVIIPARDLDVKRLTVCLQSIRSSEELNTIPIIISDFGSSKENQDSIAEVSKKFSVKHVITDTNSPWSRSCALNIGARHAQTEWLIFTDADMIFSPRLLRIWAHYVSELGDNRLFLAQCKKLPPLKELYVDGAQLDFESLSSKGRLFEAFGHGGFQAICRRRFIDMTGFNETYNVWGCEDNDLSWRAELMGQRVTWLPPGELLHQWHLKYVDEASLAINRREYEKVRCSLETHPNPVTWGTQPVSSAAVSNTRGQDASIQQRVMIEVQNGILNPRASSQESLDLLMRWGQHCVANELWESAIETFEDILTLCPDSVNAQLGLAITHFRRLNYGRAAHLAYCVIEKDPRNSQARELLEVTAKAISGYFSYISNSPDLVPQFAAQGISR